MTSTLPPKSRRTGLIVAGIAIALWVGYAVKSSRKPEDIPRAPASVRDVTRKHLDASKRLPFAVPDGDCPDSRRGLR